MAKFILSFFYSSNPNMFKGIQVHYVFAFVSLTIFRFLLTQTSGSESCILDIHQSSSWNNSDCEAGNWGGFVNSCSCGAVFDDYLYALARRANQSDDDQKLFLNITEQKNCFLLMKSIDKVSSGCGFENLTSGAGGCTDFSTKDVQSNLGNTFNELKQDCKLLGSAGKSDTKTCSACLKKWEEIVEFDGNGTKSEEAETMVCSFAVLISLTGSRAKDKNWIQALYRCLGDQNFSREKEDRCSKNKKLRTGLWILAGGVAGITVVVFGITWTLCRKRVEENILSGKEDSSELMNEEISCPKIPIKEVYLATNNLNSSNFIDQGVAGMVYKGILSNGQHVAVKHIIKDGHVDTFIREVTSLSHVKHPNLVSLLGYSEAVDECFLVYELCHNGNLSEWLFGKDKILSWTERLQIAIDSAKGLWFLHTYPEGCIVHRDIKPTNILIDAKFQAKLSDFGLSKVMDSDQSYVISEVRGTLGYVDPEYQRNRHVNPSGDVYSFGMVLLQLLSGQRVIDFNLSRPMPLTKRAKSLTASGSIEEFADPKLKREYSLEAFDLVFKLALSCTGHKEQRLSMTQVVITLEKALDISTKT
ncbi:Serine/threonine protein kinase [Parasponia andersonii]|uniref:Serine/threonine protein kinase n=1 Tax=Parasponia andersonii TaxID=3476 RepID=A0A2P5CE47_PARAD|nr:Serine/threonine protein kinase [Parasponia andersonii]